MARISRLTIHLLAALAAAAGAGSAVAAAPQAVKDDAFETLQGGELESTALSSDGWLEPARARTLTGDTGTEIIWDMLRDESRKAWFCATGHGGKLSKIPDGGEPVIAADTDDAELTALSPLPGGGILAAGAPSGRLYQLGSDDQLTTLTTLDAKFVWDLAARPDGTIWAATGDGGKVFKVSPGEGGVSVDLIADLHSKNILDLWFDDEGAIGAPGMLYAAGANPAWLYRLNPADPGAKAEVVFSAEADEIRALRPVAGGLALAVNSERAPAQQALSMTLRMSGAAAPGGSASGGDGEGGGGGSGGGSGGESRGMGDVFATAPKKAPGGPASVVVLLLKDGFSRPLWNSPERPIHSIASSGGDGLLVAAGGNGRVFEISASKDAFSLAADLKEDYVMRVAAADGGWMLAGARNGVLYSMSSKAAASGVYRSRVLDAQGPARWGKVHWNGEAADGQRVLVSFRSGNAEDPENGLWSDWTPDAELGNGAGADAPAGPSRFLQYRLTLEQGPAEAPPLRSDYLEVFHQQKNRPPRVRKISLGDPSPRKPSSPPGGAGGGAPGGGDSPEKLGSAGGGEGEGSGGRRPDSNPKTVNLSWTADDPNGDELVYRVYYRAADETEWKVIDDEARVTRMPLGVAQVGDGRYRFRVVATDALGNPPGEGLESELISDEIVIDNTPPRIESFEAKPADGRATIAFSAIDAGSLVAAAALDLDGGDPHPVYPEDGIFDESEERVSWTTLKLEPGEHVLTLTVTDRQGNTSVKKAVFRTGP